MTAEATVQRQLEAYNAHDLEKFIAEYADDIQVFRPPKVEPVMAGKKALAAHYAANRFNLPNLHATLDKRIVCENKVVDHERITGVQACETQALAVYEVKDDLIKTVWFYAPE